MTSRSVGSSGACGERRSEVRRRARGDKLRLREEKSGNGRASPLHTAFSLTYAT